MYTELHISVPFIEVPWKKNNDGIKKQEGFVRKMWLSGIGTQTVGGFEELAHISLGIKYKLHFSTFSVSSFLNYQFESKDIIAVGDKENILYGGLGIEF